MGSVSESAAAPILATNHVVKQFGGRRESTRIHAVNDVTLSVSRGEIVGLVGESGCGKSTLSRVLVGIESATSGEVMLDGARVTDRKDWGALRRRVQYVFQDPIRRSLSHDDNRRDIDRRPGDQRRQGEG